MLKMTRVGITMMVAVILCFTLAGGASAGIDDGLVAYYPFNGNANDESGNGNNGVVSGAILTADRFGNANSAYYFNGINSYISAPNSSSLNITAAITVSAWIKLDGVQNNYNGIINKETSLEPRPGWLLAISPSQQAVAGLYYARNYLGEPSIDTSVATATSIIDSNWHHIAIVYDGTVLVAYLDGQFSGSGPQYTSGMASNSEPLRIGIDPADPFIYGNRTFKGFIDDIRIYRRALSEAEIQELYKSADNGAQYQANLEACQEDLYQVKVNLEHANQTILSQQSQIDQLASQISNLNADITALNIQLTNLRLLNTALSTQIDSLTQKNALLQDQVNTLTQQKSQLQNELNQINLTLSNNMNRLVSYFGFSIPGNTPLEQLNNLTNAIVSVKANAIAVLLKKALETP